MKNEDGSMNWSRLLNFNPYKKPALSTRKGAIFQAHPYPTKINYESIIPFILAHTQPGEVVYDSFAGTCSTGFAAASCIERKEGALIGFEKGTAEVEWGARKAICFDIGKLPTFIGRSLAKPVDPKGLTEAFNEWISRIEEEWGWLYEAKDPEGNDGILRHIFTSNIIRCPNCGEHIPYIEAFVDFQKSNFEERATCLRCSCSIDSKDAEPTMEKVKDRLLNEEIMRVKRIPYLVYGKTEGRNWERKATAQDTELIQRIERTPLPKNVRPIPMMGKERGKKWGEMYRSGYHRDISHIHHFYSPRNLLALATLYGEARKIPSEYRDQILLAISSYNAANSTLMARFVFKKGIRNPVITSAEPAALYIPNCQVEKNVFAGIRRKFKKIAEALREISRWNPNISIQSTPAQDNNLEPNSIDYIFTDPPFGENIQYSEVNFLSEAWLESFTDNKYETIISNHQKKSVDDYETLLTEAFRENYRVLKPGKFMTIVFHSTSKKVWNGLQRAILQSGFQIVDTSILDKTQTSFKQTTTDGAVKKDPIILAWKPEFDNHDPSNYVEFDAKEFVTETLSRVEDEESQERTFDYLYGRFVGYRLSFEKGMPVDAKEFKKILTSIAEEKNGYWHLKKEI